MKKSIYMTVLALISAGGIFWSCQKDELLNPEEGLMLKKGSVTPSVTYESIVKWDDPVCLGTETEFKLEGWKETKNIGVQIYDENLKEWVSVTGIPDGQVASPQTFYLTFPEEKTYLLRYSVSGNQDEGGTKGQIEFAVEVINCKVCDDASFSYETKDNLDITFSYNHSEEAELTIEFNFPQVMNQLLNDDGKYVAPDGKIYSVNNPDNQTNFTWTGYVGCNAEKAETFSFAMAADCGPSTAKDGQANIWTDATITAINGVKLIDNPDTPENEGPISLKGELSNIVYSGCPITTNNPHDK